MATAHMQMLDMTAQATALWTAMETTYAIKTKSQDARMKRRVTMKQTQQMLDIAIMQTPTMIVPETALQIPMQTASATRSK